MMDTLDGDGTPESAAPIVLHTDQHADLAKGVVENDTNIPRTADHSAALNDKLTELLGSVIGADAARAIHEECERGASVREAWSKLLALRNEKHTELEQLLLSLDRTSRAPQPEEMSEEWWKAFELRNRIRRVAATLTSLESDIARAFGNSKTLKRVDSLVLEYTFEGFVFDPPEQRGGYSLRCLQEAVVRAYKFTHPIISAVYNDPHVLELDEPAFKAELIARLDSRGQAPGETRLDICACTIHLARTYRDARNSLGQAHRDVEHVLKHLRNERFAEWLRPLGKTGGKGSGPAVACYHFIELTTGVGWASVRDYVRGSRAP